MRKFDSEDRLDISIINKVFEREWIMNKLMNGLTVGSASLAVGGLTALLVPNQAAAVAIAGSVGSGGAAVVVQQRKDKVARDREQHLLGEFQQVAQQMVQPIDQRMTAVELRIGSLEQAMQQARATELAVAAPEVALEVVVEQPKASETSAAAAPNQVSLAEAAADAIAWLGERNVEVTTFRHSITDQDVVFDRVALSLGRQFEILGALYRSIKRSAAQGGNIVFSVVGRSQTELGAMTNFCTLLDRHGMFSFYRYDRAKKALLFAVQPRNDIRRLLTGEWFERYVYQVVVKVLGQRGVAFSALMNPQVRLPNGDRFEFDLLFLCEGHPLWLECKTGKDINEHLLKYSRHRQTLGVSKARSLLVMLGYTAAQSEELERLWEMTAASERSVEELVTAALGEV